MDKYDARAAEILEKAADLLETVGHAKGKSIRYSDDNERITGYCATGAVTQQMTNQKQQDWRVRTRAYRALADLIPRDGFENEMTNKIICWNDASERTAAEVIDLMKHAAKDLRNKQ